VRYLLDTNHWSYVQERNPAVIAHVSGLPDDAELFMSVVSQAELLGGIELVAGERRRRELSGLYREAVEAATDLLPIASEEARHFARIYAELRRRGKAIDTNDMWIAATARAHRLTVVSNDQHFQYVDGIEVEDWSKLDGSGAHTA